MSYEIIYIDDRFEEAEKFICSLRENGMENPVKHLRNGMEAVEYFFQLSNQPLNPNASATIVLLNMDLQKLSATEVLKKIRTLPASLNLPVIAMVNRNAASKVQSSAALGVQAFVERPLNFSEFQQCILNISYPLQQMLVPGI